MNKWHINKHGVPAPCKAKNGNCPLGSSEQHFKTEEEARAYAHKVGKETHELLPEVKTKTRKAKTKADYSYLASRKMQLANESSKLGSVYINRCRTCRKLNNYKQAQANTVHFEQDRQDKVEGLIKLFGEGNSLGFYEVDHLVGVGKRQNYKKQIVEVLDNGRIIIYDEKTGRTVTTFMAHRARIEAMLLLNNEIPDKDFLEDISNNRLKAEQHNLG